jgi:hypothetical protein
VLAIIIASTLPSVSQAPDEAVKTQLREVTLENLLSERGSLKTFNKLIESARQAGISEQSILEARFLYHIDRVEDKAIAAMYPEFTKQQKLFKLEDSSIFATVDDWLAAVEYVHAIAALQNGDKAGFKKHITEAFWLGPRQAIAFAPQIERLRHEEAMNSITIDFNTEVTLLSGKGQSTLKNLVADKKALLLHFWSPQIRECETSLPDFAKTSKMLAQHQIAIASLTPEATPLAQGMAQPYSQEVSGIWATDSATHSLAHILRVQNLPTMTLIDPHGKILFSGDPTDDQFWNTLQTVDSTITRPKLDEDTDP